MSIEKNTKVDFVKIFLEKGQAAKMGQTLPRKIDF